MSDVRDLSKRLLFLDGLRGIAIFMVVAIHAAEYSNLSDNNKHFVLSFFQIAVSAFFLADGYLFFYQNGTGRTFKYPSYLAKSAARLLIPWVIFNTIYLMLRGLLEFLDYLPDKIVVSSTVPHIAIILYVSSISSQMYFLLSLFLIRLCAPIIKLLRLLPSYGIAVIFFSYALAWNNLDISALSICSSGGLPGGCFDPIMHALWGLQFYLLGACLYTFGPRLHSPAAITTIIILLYIVAKITNSLTPVLEQYFHLLTSYFIVTALIRSENLLTRLGTMTMGIYLLHMPIVLKAASLIVPRVFGRQNPLTNYALITLATFFVSLFLVIALSKIELGRYSLGMRDADFVPKQTC
jgi:peptidoglycan/LPS O-acetylase OafA/YrhL